MAAAPKSPPPSAPVADHQAVERLRIARVQLKAEIAKLVVGQDRVIDSCWSACSAAAMP